MTIPTPQGYGVPIASDLINSVHYPLVKLAAGSDGTATNLSTTPAGELVVRPYASAAGEWSTPAPNAGIAASTTPYVVKGAPGAGLRNYITSLGLQTATLGNATEFCIRDTALTAASQTIAANTIVTSAAHGLTVGDAVVPSASTITGFTAGTQYYVQSVPLTTSFTVSATPGGAVAAISGTGVTATINHILFRTQLQTTAMPFTSISLGNPLKGGINQQTEVVTLTSATGGVYANLTGFVAASA